jgi:hypothetical protein
MYDPPPMTRKLPPLLLLGAFLPGVFFSARAQEKKFFPYQRVDYERSGGQGKVSRRYATFNFTKGVLEFRRLESDHPIIQPITQKEIQALEEAILNLSAVNNDSTFKCQGCRDQPKHKLTIYVGDSTAVYSWHDGGNPPWELKEVQEEISDVFWEHLQVK